MISSGDSTKNSELQELFEIGAFYLAATTRLRRLQSTTENSIWLHESLPDIRQTVHECFKRSEWCLVIAFYDILHERLDRNGYWNYNLTLNKWALEAASQIGDIHRRARFAHQRGTLQHQRGENREAEQLFRISEEAFRSVGEERSALESLHMRALVVRAEGRLSEAQKICDRVISEAQRLCLDRWLAHPLFIQGLLARDRGDIAAAEQYVVRGLELLNVADEPAMVAQCQQFLGELALLRRDWDQARLRLETSERLYRDLGGIRQLLGAKRLLADLARFEGRLDDVERLYNEALRQSYELGDQVQYARLLLAKAQVTRQAGQMVLAIDLLRSAITAYQAIGNDRAVAGLFGLLAWWHLRHGQVRRAFTALWTAFQTGRRAGLLYPRALLGMLIRGRRL